MEQRIRLTAFNVNDMRGEGKTGELIKGFKDGKLDVLGVRETHLSGKGV